MPSGGVPEGHWYLVKFSVRQVAGQPNFPAGQGVQGVLVFRPLYPDTYSNSLETTYPCDSTSWCDYAIAFKASDTHTNANPPGFMFQVPPLLSSFNLLALLDALLLALVGRGTPDVRHCDHVAPALWRYAAAVFALQVLLPRARHQHRRVEGERRPAHREPEEGSAQRQGRRLQRQRHLWYDEPLLFFSFLFFSFLVDHEDDGDMFYWCTGASVKVLQQRHEFPLGTAVDHWTIADNSNPTYKAKILEYFNYIVLENGLKQVYWVLPPVPHIF
jgi:hypothetical protein